MKKYISIMLFAVVITGTIFSCKKSNTPGPKDYSLSVKDKTWWGALVYTGKSTEYYSVHFNADNSLTWSQMSGDYNGQWVLTGKQLTITFSGNSVEIKADISDDDKLMNITDNTANSEITNGQLIANPNISLDNTVWKGSIVYSLSSTDYQITFLPGTKLQAKYLNVNYVPDDYTRSASGAVIRTFGGGVVPIFGVIVSDKEMKGGRITTDYPWQVSKQ